METIENLLISRGELDRIYVGQVKLYLWRSLHKSIKSRNPLYPDFDPRQIRAGVVRLPDVEVETIQGVELVIAKLGKGTSLFDRQNVFEGTSWAYFEIPKGTEIPYGLIITKDSFNTKFKATHYTISPNFTMPKIQLIKLLDKLAENAQTQKRKLSNGRS